MKRAYMDSQYSAYTLWDDVEEYEVDELDDAQAFQCALSDDSTRVLLVVSHGGDHPLSGLPEKRLLIEMDRDAFKKLVASVNGIEQTLGSKRA